MPAPRDRPPPSLAAAHDPAHDRARHHGLRARLRALAIAVALLVQCTSATPQQPLTHAQLARPEGQRALALIERGLGVIGAQPGREAVTRELLDWTERAVRLRGAVLAPFAPLVRFAELDQRWTLFTGTGPETFRMHVEARRGDERWRNVYRAPGADDALSQRLHYRRVRGLYNPSVRSGARPEYPGFTRWLAAELFAARPELHTVRVRMERLSVGEPGSVPVRLRYEHAHVHRRGALP